MASIADRIRGVVSKVVYGTGAWAPDLTTALEAGSPSIVFGAGFAAEVVDGMSVGDLYQTQPNLRSVVDFTSRNAAQLGRQVLRPDGKGGRERARDSFLETLLKSPNDYQTGFDLFKQLFAELALYDFHLWVIDTSRKSGGFTITGIPTEWINGTKVDAFGRVAKYRVQPTGSSEWFYVNVEDAVVFRGYNPHGFSKGSSPVKSLRNTLSEQIAAGDFRRQMWKRGGRIGMYWPTRPADAPEWSAEGKAKFLQQWKAQWSGGGAEAGGTPLLDEGMEMKRVGFNAREEQWAEGAQLALGTVAQAFHVPPAMVGAQGYNSFASVKEFRKMLYTETLGPSVAQVEDTVNTFLVPLLGIKDGSYLELNIGEKLQGDFEEQAAVTSTAVGGPRMTANEARARVNLPAIAGGDELLAPLNMGAAGNSGPAAAEPIGTEPSGAAEIEAPGKTAPEPNGSHVAERHDGRKAPDTNVLHEDLELFFAAQRKAILAKLGQKGPAWFDQKHWNSELSAVLRPHLTTISAGTARRVAGAKGLNPADYSVARTENFIKAVADSRADLINATTRDHYQNAVDNDTDPATVFEDTESRSKTVGGTLLTFITAWAAVEVAKQLMPDKKPTKTWLASGLPNSRHADLDGETVPIDEPFSNGAQWPGDPVLGAEGVANCGCGVDISEGA